MFLKQRQILLYSIISLLIVVFLGYLTVIASKNIEAFYAKNLSKSKYIYFENMDERKFTQYRIAYEQGKVDIIVMGSSRLMQLGSNSFKRPTLNLSVSGASVEDLVAFIPESVNKFKASVVYIGADPWLFNKKSGQTRFTSVNNMYSFWKKKIQSCSMLVAAEDEKGWFYLIFTRSPYTHNQMISFLKQMPGGLHDAIYLEGGPETSLLIDVNGPCITKVGSWVSDTWESDANKHFWPLPNIIGVSKK